MSVLKFIVRTIFLVVAVAAFFGVPACWVGLKAQGIVWGVVATLVIGRFFCDAMCPLGIVQSLVRFLAHPKNRARRVCSRLPETGAQIVVRWTIVAVVVALCACGYKGIAEMTMPISIFGKAMTLWLPGLVVAGIVVVLAAIGDGRIWCNWICPYGTIYNLLAKMTLARNRVGKGCGACRKCFAAEKEEIEGGMTRRETLKGVAVLAVSEKIGDGGFAEVTPPGVPTRSHPVLPPGAGDGFKFAMKCVSCQLCVANCPGGCLKPSTALKRFGRPELDFRSGYCLSTCAKCGEVCPEGAIQKLQSVMRPNVHMGYAVWKKNLCVRTTEGDKCTACERKCPVRAIRIIEGYPVVNREKCIGCGACEHVCPARPQPAICVEGYEVQKIVKPMGESDLLAEMIAKIDGGAAVVAARGGVITAVEEGRGLKPLVKLLDDEALFNAVVVDKVIGRAAAAICVVGGARKVHAKLAASGAAELLAKHHVGFSAEKTVDVILNRDKTGSCPMEAAVKDLNDPAKMVEAIRKAMKK